MLSNTNIEYSSEWECEHGFVKICSVGRTFSANSAVWPRYRTTHVRHRHLHKSTKLCRSHTRCATGLREWGKVRSSVNQISGTCCDTDTSRLVTRDAIMIDGQGHFALTNFYAWRPVSVA